MKLTIHNPFRISGYISPKYFCGREDETQELLSAIQNQRNITLFSHRRMGKTGLIHHVMHELKNEKQVSAFYMDIMSTANINEFINQFGKAVVGKIESKGTNIMKKIGHFFSHLRPVITYDSLDGSPMVTFNIQSESDARSALQQIFLYLEKQNQQIVIFIDEFQQITTYPEANVEAFLRSFVQNVSNVNFVFSGSHQHLLLSMFGDHSRPFYQSTELMCLHPIPEQVYIDFMFKHFKADKRKIDKESARHILELTRYHTFYVQYLCNKLYAQKHDQISIEVINLVFRNILKENESLYYNFRNLLTDQQWGLLKAIAKEDKVEQPTSKDFIKKYNLNTPSTVKTALDSLLKKEMIFEDKGAYHVYDVFLSRWLQWRN